MSKWRDEIILYGTIASGLGGIAAVLMLCGVSFKIGGTIEFPTHGLLATAAVILYIVTLAGVLYFRTLRNQGLAKAASETSRADETLERLRETAKDLDTSLARQKVAEEDLQAMRRRHKEMPAPMRIAGSGDLQSAAGAMLAMASFKLTIHSAKWGTGGTNYVERKDVLIGYLTAGTADLRASIEFFGHEYKNEPKHLIVTFSCPGSATVKTHTYQENALISAEGLCGSIK